MIPTINDILTITLESVEQPSKNYKMYFTADVINGFNDELGAMKQVIFKILNTERYEYVIYSKNYGIELKDLFGEPTSYICAELERRITEALVQDDRIKAVGGFSFDIIDKRIIQATFTVYTVFGDIIAEKAVKF